MSSHLVKQRLLSQYSESELLDEFIDIFVNQLDKIEPVQQDLLNKRNIFAAQGQQLDFLGGLLGEDRLGRSDASYREALLFRVFLNTSNPTPETIIKITDELTNANLVYYWENYPAAYTIYTDGEDIFAFGQNKLTEFVLGGRDDNNDPFRLELSDGSLLRIRFGFQDSTLFIDFLKRMSPAAIGAILVEYSLGNTPFSFAGSAITAAIEFDDESLWELADGSLYEVTLQDFAELPAGDDGEGFAAVAKSQFNVVDTDGNEYALELSDGSLVGILDSSNFSIVGDGNFVGGIQNFV